jgi:hypothetical protein
VKHFVDAVEKHDTCGDAQQQFGDVVTVKHRAP